MFCEKCGTKLLEDAIFCSNCGISIIQETEKSTTLDDAQIQLTVKPTFKFEYVILPGFLVSIIFILLISFTIGIISIHIAILVFLILFLILLTVIVLETIIYKKQYNRITYDFYKTKVIYKDSFINLSEKEIKYKYIREVTMRQSFIQRAFNIGNIILYTNAETGFGNGINILNVEDVKSVYESIKNIVNV